MERAQEAGTPEFVAGLYEPGFSRRFLADRLGSTTHITALDGDGGCASVTCSNGSGSGVFVEGTGIQLNNMLGEEDLDPLGFHSTVPGRRMPSMMSPTVALRDGELVLGLGSGGSNRIRSAVSQTIIRYLGEGMTLESAVDAPRVHFEGERSTPSPESTQWRWERSRSRVVGSSIGEVRASISAAYTPSAPIVASRRPPATAAEGAPSPGPDGPGGVSSASSSAHGPGAASPPASLI